MKMSEMSFLEPEPYKIKMVEPILIRSRQYRETAIREAHFNTFLLKSEDVYIDLLTDSGTSAMSDYQWAGIMLGDEAYAGSKNFYKLESNVRQYYGYDYVLPTHQGRGAEHILSQILIKKGDIVPGNMYFTTTRAHQELAGASFVDVIIDQAHDSECEHPFKGNVDLLKLQNLIERAGAENIPYLNMQACVNMAGGQPFSLANLQEVSNLCHKHGIKVVLDATRAMENAFFIQRREAGQGQKSCARILYEICSLTDACTMSGKKDLLVNMGGFLALRDQELYSKACELVVLFEGLHTYGGMSGRDMEAMARGIEEAVSDTHLQARIAQVEYLAARLIEHGIPVVLPAGGHAVYVDAAKFLPHLKQSELPAQTLAAALYLKAGVRAMERGVVSAGRDPLSGDHRYPKLELLRLTIPRRVYTRNHIDFVATALAELFQEKQEIAGLRITYEPETLRFFQAHFEPLKKSSETARPGNMIYRQPGLARNSEDNTAVLNYQI